LTTLREAATLSQKKPVHGDLVRHLAQVVASLNASETTAGTLPDPLETALLALQAAAVAVEAGYYGTRSEKTPLKDTAVIALWNRIRQAALSPEGPSLMRSLQKRGWVQERSK
jgi:hypothetical protein